MIGRLLVASSLVNAVAAPRLVVSPSGNDAQPGTESHPFATLGRARDAARKLDGPVTVRVRGGVYGLTHTLRFGPEDAGVTFEVNDLYASHFNPIMTMEDFNQFTGLGRLPEDVLSEQKKVDGAECIALVYPVWWNDGPATLKGWLDRVLAKGWAYEITPEGSFVPLLKLRKVVILNTAGNPADLNEGGGLNGAARLTKNLGTFRFCGVADIQHHILDDVMADETGRREFLERARRIGSMSSHRENSGTISQGRRKDEQGTD